MCILVAAPPFLGTVEMESADEDDLNKWYEEEHLELLSKMPGYRRSLRYTIGPPVPEALRKTEPAKYLAIHEVDSLSAFDSKEAEKANTTPWSVKHITGSKVFIPRGWELIHKEGF